MDEEPDQHLQIDLFATERQTFPYQMSQPETPGRVEPFDVLGASNPVERTKNDALVDGQTIGVTPGFQVGRGKALPEAEGPDAIAQTDKTADNLAGQAVHREPDPALLCLTCHTGA